jgi:hypothetical protein
MYYNNTFSLLMPHPPTLIYEGGRGGALIDKMYYYNTVYILMLPLPPLY